MGLLPLTTSLVLLLTLFFRCSVYASSSDIGTICQSMWDADTNSLVSGVDFNVNIQNKAVSYKDSSSGPLFQYVNALRINGPTFTAFRNLMDNYYMDIGKTEYRPRQEIDENNRFLTAIMATRTMKKLHEYLVAKVPSKVSSNSATFQRMLYVMWFYFYDRGAHWDSSGFEHVFLGEKSNRGGNTVKGFHNWLQFYLKEKSKSANYHGYYALTKTKPTLLKLKFAVDGNYDKPVSSFFLGTSPEFEFGLYTACFILKPDQECSCRINSNLIRIKTYGYSGGKYIGTAFPLA